MIVLGCRVWACGVGREEFLHSDSSNLVFDCRLDPNSLLDCSKQELKESQPSSKI